MKRKRSNNKLALLLLLVIGAILPAGSLFAKEREKKNLCVVKYHYFLCPVATHIQPCSVDYSDACGNTTSGEKSDFQVICLTFCVDDMDPYDTDDLDDDPICLEVVRLEQLNPLYNRLFNLREPALRERLSSGTKRPPAQPPESYSLVY